MSQKEKIINPHDKFFKEAFSKKEDAQEFLSNYLPEDIKALIDLSTLSIHKDSFIEKELREYFSDILYRVKTKGKNIQNLWIYLLFEHKSYPDERIAYKLLRYMVKIFPTSSLARTPHFLPLSRILPISSMIFQHTAMRR